MRHCVIDSTNLGQRLSLFGWRALYRTLELPGANPLKDAHAALDTVLTACGFSAKKDLLAQLLALNQEVAAKLRRADPSPSLACRKIILTRTGPAP
jgi:hypothetical protein